MKTMVIMIQSEMSPTDIQRRKSKAQTRQGKCHFKCVRVPFLLQIISRHGVQPDPKNLHVFTEMPCPKFKSLMYSAPEPLPNYARP